jgi:hypothetical protein
MTAAQALKLAASAGIQILIDGDDLALSSASPPPQDVLALLRFYKPEILELLRPLARRPSRPTSPPPAWAPKDWRAYYDERAGIAEFDGGLPRAEVEARAYQCCVAEWLIRRRRRLR